MPWPDFGNITTLNTNTTITQSGNTGGGSCRYGEGGSGLFGGAVGSGEWLRRAGGQAAGCEAAEAVRKAESKSVTFGSEADKGHSLARLEQIDRVGELAVMERSAVTDC